MADPNNVKSIFLAASEKPAAARSAFLDEATGSDTILRARVEALLKAHDNPDSFLNDAAAEFGATIDLSPAEAPLAEKPGTLIGPYKLLEQIGEGGMGVVYMADQQEPVRRRIALKVIKAGMDTRQVIARFEAERQALALMDHSNIARVLDAGATESGRPYFVMELVRGIPITEYCDQNNLPVHERLELFVQVCHAVQHAHQKGIIHRDLKPTNVLVTLNDGRAVPKVIDFGVAKATGQQLAEKTLFTAFAQMVGTPLYMSPEQAEMTSVDIDTRSDIYSLGVLLYELLTGTTPFDQERMRAAAFDEIRRIIRDEEPPKPSTRISTLGETGTATAAHRKVDSHRLSRLVEGDLDWIVMKALEKDRTRRYDTAGNFAADVLRHLSDEPVDACPPSAVYRFRKFARRNKAGVLAGMGIAVAMLIGLTLASLGFFQARRQAQIAAAEAIKATAARGKAEEALIDKVQALREKDDALTLAQEKELLQRQRFYAAQMNLAQQALASDDPARVLDILDQNRPRPGEPDLRGFEWHYLWGQIHRGLRASIFFPEGRAHWGLAISPDGNTVAISGLTAQDGGIVKLWDTDSGRLKQSLSLRASGAALLAFAPDGAVLVSGTWDGTISLWRRADRSELARISSGFGLVRALRFSPDGKHLAAGFSNGAVQILDAVSLKTVAKLKSHRDVINAFYSPDGTRLYSASAFGTEGIVTKVHDLTKNPPEVVGELKGLRATDISPDGRYLVGVRSVGVTMWDISAKQKIWQFRAHSELVSDAKFTPDGKFLITAGRQDRLAALWNIATQKAVMRVPHPAELLAVACTGGEKSAWISLSNDGTARIWELTPPADTSTISLEKPIKHMVAVPGGRSLILGGDFPARTWDLLAGKLTDRTLSAMDVRSISADGRLLAAVEALEAGGKIAVKIWDTSSGETRHIIGMPDNDSSLNVRISPDGKRLATCASGGPILIWDLTSERSNVPEPLSIQYRDPRGQQVLLARHFAFSPDSVWLAAACQFGVVNLYNLKTKQTVLLPLPEASWTNRVAFSWDGKRVASGNDLGVVSLFDMEKAELIASLTGHEASIQSLAFFPDGRTLAVGSRGTIRLWDLPSRQERITLRLSPDTSTLGSVSVVDLAVTPDGSTLISAPSDGTVRIWKGDSAAADRTMTAFTYPNPADKDVSTDPKFFARRAIAHIGLGHWGQAKGDFQQAEQLGIEWDRFLIRMMIQALPADRVFPNPGEQEAVKQFQELVMSSMVRVDDPNTLNAIAWNIVSLGTNDRTLTAMAVQVAEKAARLSPENGNIENTLGVAYYRAGQWQSAVETLDKSMDLRKGGDASDWFFLAMAHWQLGHKDEARKWYDQAIEWMDNNRPENEELLRFRNEAAELLGISEPAKSTDAATQP